MWSLESKWLQDVFLPVELELVFSGEDEVSLDEFEDEEASQEEA